MNSFALLQDDVEDDGAAVTQEPSRSAQDEPRAPLIIVAPKPPVDITPPRSESTDKPPVPPPAGEEDVDEGKGDADEGAKDEESSKEKDLTLEEYLEQKATLANTVGSLNKRGLRHANDGEDGFAKMSVLKKKADGKEVMTGVAVKEVHETKGLKDSTHAAVARNAEIQKFFQKDPNERRPAFRGRGRGDFRGRGRGLDRGRGERGRGGDRSDRSDRGGRGAGDRGERGRGGFTERGRGRGRGGFRDNGFRGSHDNNHFAPKSSVVVAPNVDDISAFPSL